MTDQNNAAKPVLTDDEIRDIITDAHQAYGAFKTGYGLALGRAFESALLSKLRAPKPLGDSCHHCGWTDWLSQDGKAYCQACGKPHGSVPAEGLPNLPELLRENADLDEAEGGNLQVCSLERDAADEIERLRREVAKLRAPVADEPLGWKICFTDRDGQYKTVLHGHNAVGDYRSIDPMASSIPLGPYSAAQASAPVAGEAYQGDSVAERLDNMADDQPPGSQAQSDLYAAATIWRKHIAHRAAPQASEAVRDEDTSPIMPDDEEISGACINASDIDGIAYDGPSFERGYRAALSAQPGAQKKGGSDA